jgi:hypothetical protein
MMVMMMMLLRLLLLLLMMMMLLLLHMSKSLESALQPSNLVHCKQRKGAVMLKRYIKLN